MITDHINAGFPQLWIQSFEPYRVDKMVLAEINAINKTTSPTPPYAALRWDVADGIIPLDHLEELANKSHKRDATDPKAMLNKLTYDLPENTIIVAHNFSNYLKAPEIIQTVQTAYPIWKSHGKTLIVVSAISTLPIELEKLFYMIELPLPSTEELQEVTTTMIDNANTALIENAKMKPLAITPKTIENVLHAGIGLTTMEYEAAIALSLARYGTLKPHVINEIKAQLVKKSETLQFWYPSEIDTFKFLGGLDRLKEFSIRILQSELYRAILLVGVPGAGKSAFAKALGAETHLPVVQKDFGKSYTKFLGESEERERNSLRIVDALGKCILFCDEIEKGLSGIQSSHMTDGGTGSRVGSTFLTWMNDRLSGQAFVIGTCNDIEKLPPEYKRAGRWDAIFFVNLPNTVEQKIIWKIWGDYYGVDASTISPETYIGWTGGEINTCCRLAKAFDTTPKEVAQYITPIVKSDADVIDALRKWAEGRTVSASIPIEEKDVKMFDLAEYATSRKINVLGEKSE